MKLETKILVDVCGVLQQYGVTVSLSDGMFSFDIGEALEKVPSATQSEAERTIMSMLWSLEFKPDDPVPPEEELKVRPR